jgi:hypothetical protein
MVFSDTTNKNGIIQFCESLCKLGDGGITNDAVLFKQFTSYLNEADKKIFMALLRVDKNWKVDDTNYTDFPIATIDLVAGQRDYTLPAATSGGNASTLYKVNRIRVKNSAGIFEDIPLMDSDDKETDDTITSFPSGYRLIGNMIRFKELLANVTTTGGMEITFQRSMTLFTVASTTVQPGFIDAYHSLLAYDASSSYLLPIDRQLAIDYKSIFDEGVNKLQGDYSNRNDNNPTAFSAQITQFR